ncbi:hypothetical protein [Glycomyces sp. NPDC048151]|uniref:hypothetical protein n=1 Tax=Glycomyces sp. NPDC048151 TaxID=3364002 RepID=UPI0037102388
MSDTVSGIKIGTADFTGRVVSGLVPEGEPGSVVLRQLYPGDPVDIGVIDQIEPVTAQITIYPGHRKVWSDADRTALTFFFANRYRDRNRLATLLDFVAVAEVVGESADGR